MATYLPLFFLKEKIGELQTALFYNFSTSVFKCPTSVINVLETDDCGQIWFCLPSDGKFINELDKEFPALLQFFKKGKSFHVRINGRAFIVNDPEQVNSIAWANPTIKNDAIQGKLMLLKVKIEFADYFEQKQKVNKAQERKEWSRVFKEMYSFIFETEYSKYSFLHAPQSNSFPGRIQYQ